MALYIVGFDDLVTSFVATIVTGWSDPCRVGLSPTGKPRLYAAHEKDGLGLPYTEEMEARKQLLHRIAARAAAA